MFNIFLHCIVTINFLSPISQTLQPWHKIQPSALLNGKGFDQIDCKIFRILDQSLIAKYFYRGFDQILIAKYFEASMRVWLPNIKMIDCQIDSRG